MSDVAADVAAFLAADTTDVLAADTTDVLYAAKADDGPREAEGRAKEAEGRLNEGRCPGRLQASRALTRFMSAFGLCSPG